MRVRNWLFDNFRAAAKSFGFEEYDAPILETEELYIRKQGEEITQQLYNFEDKGGRKVTLRPEMTPSLARMVLAKANTLPMPLKWYSIPQCWRYERMQRGRLREHYQWNMDIWGSEGAEAEVELLCAMVNFFQRIGVDSTQVGIRVNNRKLLQHVLESAGINEEQFAPVCIVIDKMDKISKEVIKEQLTALGLTSETIELIQSTLALRDLNSLNEVLGEDNPALNELNQVWALAESYGISEWLEFDASVVRGLAYYTGTVFEAFDRNGTLRAICGGGRYDTLLSTFGGADIPACGFGFGDVVIMELLSDLELIPELPSGIDDIVFAMNEDLRGAAMQVANRLRSNGRSVDLILKEKKMKWVFKHAERSQAKTLVLITPDEWEQGKVRIKDLVTKTEIDLNLEEL
jgi:histidyl-tRNA synthetase